MTERANVVEVSVCKDVRLDLMFVLLEIGNIRGNVVDARIIRPRKQEAISVTRSRSNFCPSTGFSSNRQSPESIITPIGVRITTAVESGIE